MNKPGQTSIPPGGPAEPNESPLDEMVSFFKALADPTRLKILGLLSREPLSVEQIAEMVGLRASTVSHHLQYLVHEKMVSAQPQSYYNIYRLEPKTLEAMAHRLLSADILPQAAAEADVDAYDRKVLANFVNPDGTVHTFPAQRKKFEVILRYVLRDFKPGVRYSETQVNQMLRRYHEDTATLRRELIGYGWLKRAGGGSEYWLPSKETETGTDNDK